MTGRRRLRHRHADQGNFAEAGALIGEALDLEPERSDWWADLGEVLRDAGVTEKARKSFSIALELGDTSAADELARLDQDNPSAATGGAG